MSASLKLISLNIERSVQLQHVISFLRDRQSDVACLQEVYERDIPAITEALGYKNYIFAPMARYVRETPPEMMGVAIFSRFPIVTRDIFWYGGNPEVVQELDQENQSTWNNKNFPLAVCDVEKDGSMFRIGNTHLTWTPDGKPTDLQRGHTKELLRILESSGELVFCGDFNAPRGGEIWGKLTAKYKDNIPAHYTSSLDPNLHRAGRLQLVVDGIFSTPAYTVSEVEMISGVSDHCALVATISKTG